eukprot:1728726-Prymnesium_polylepis.1
MALRPSIMLTKFALPSQTAMPRSAFASTFGVHWDALTRCASSCSSRSGKPASREPPPMTM